MQQIYNQMNSVMGKASLFKNHIEKATPHIFSACHLYVLMYKKTLSFCYVYTTDKTKYKKQTISQFHTLQQISYGLRNISTT